MQETQHKLLCLNSFLFKLFIDLHPSTGQAEDPFCVHIFTLRHFRLVSELDDPALHFHLCLLPAIVTSVVVCRQPPPSHLSPTIPRSRSSLSTHLNTRSHVILKRMHPMCPSPITRTPTQHLGFGRRPLLALFQPSNRRFGIVWIVGLYTSVPGFHKFCAMCLLLDTCP